MKRVLNVGGGSRAISLPPQYSGFEQTLLDIDSSGNPDIACDARQLTTLPAQTFDAVYCSHNLEHYFRHDVPKVLAGFLHVLKDGGFVQIRVPDLAEVMRVTLERGLDVEDVLYESASGPIQVLDVIYGYGKEIERSGADFYTHKTGFTQKSLVGALARAGFSQTYTALGNLEIVAIAFKGEPDPGAKALFGFPLD